MLVAAGAGDYATLVVAETVAGLGGSSYHPAGMSLISDLEGGATEGTAMGIHGLGGVVGTALAPALIGGLAALSGWRVALALGAGVGVLSGGVFRDLFRDFRGGGSAATVGIDGLSDPTADGSALGSLVSVPRERWVGVLFLANLTIATELGAVRTFVTPYLVEHAGVSTGVANAVFFLMLVGAGVSSLGAGALADSTDRRILGAGVMAASTVVLAATALVPSVPLALLGWFLVVGAVTWAALRAMNAITSRYSERRFSGSLFGVMLTAGSLGGAGGPLLFGVVAERLGMGTAFPVIGAVSAFGAVVFLAMGRPPGAADRSAG
jgi:MFS family permease